MAGQLPSAWLMIAPTKGHGEGGPGSCGPQDETPSLRSWRQLYHAFRVNPGQRIGHAHAGDHLFRCDLGEWHQHEGALEQARVGQREVRLFQNHIVVGEQVDIDRARTPALLAGAVAPKRSLHRLRARQERMRRQIGFDRDAYITERRLVLDPPGGRAIVGGAGEKTHAVVAECGDRAIEGVARVSDIAAERDERFSHDSSVPVPMFVSLCSTRSYERRNQRDTSNYMILVWPWI